MALMLAIAGCVSRQTCEPQLAPVEGQPVPPKQCYVDGCTLSPDLDFKHCCDAHDQQYWRGGTRAERKDSDLMFRNCIAKQNHPGLSYLYYFGVRVGGVSFLPTPWRWGFGWHFPNAGDQDIPSQ